MIFHMETRGSIRQKTGGEVQYAMLKAKLENKMQTQEREGKENNKTSGAAAKIPYGGCKGTRNLISIYLKIEQKKR